MGKKIFIFFILFTIISLSFLTDSSQAAKKTSKKGGIKAEEIQAMSDTIDNLTKKVYAHSLFSPQDNQKMVEIKLKLDNQMLITPDASLAPIYYKAGNLYKARKYQTDAIECYQTVLENFADTAIAPKAAKELKALGVEVILPSDEESENEEEI